MVQLWPPVDIPSTLTRQVWDSETARMIPGVGRALAIYGLLAQCELDAFRGIRPVTRPRLLEAPDPDWTRSGFVRVHVEDYLLHGNACHLVTVRDRTTGWPAAVRWFPAHAWSIVDDPGGRAYYLHGHRVPSRDVIHAQRGADPSFPGRGVGVVEQHLRALDRVALQEANERENNRGRGMPGVAIITPQKEPAEQDLDAAADKWLDRFSGPVPKPAFLPNGTQVVPLAWSPSDQQMTEARKLAHTDVANMFNLDGYWVGAPGSSHTYRSPGPLFTALLRTSLEPVATELELTWSREWLPHGQRVTFKRSDLTVDDLQTSIQIASAATSARLWTYEEARTYLRMDPDVEQPEAQVTAPPAPAPVPEPQDDQQETPPTGGQLEDEEATA